MLAASDECECGCRRPLFLRASRTGGWAELKANLDVLGSPWMRCLGRLGRHPMDHSVIVDGIKALMTEKGHNRANPLDVLEAGWRK